VNHFRLIDEFEEIAVVGLVQGARGYGLAAQFIVFLRVGTIMICTFNVGGIFLHATLWTISGLVSGTRRFSLAAKFIILVGIGT
jgi:hypothetical protein